MSLEVTYDSDAARVRVVPEYGKPVIFAVSHRLVPVTTGWRRRQVGRFVVHLAPSAGHFSVHTSFEAACNAMLRRANRYDRAYSVRRGLGVDAA